MAIGFIDVTDSALGEFLARIPANVKILGTEESQHSVCRFRVDVIGSDEPHGQLWTMEVKRDQGPRINAGVDGGGYFTLETVVFRPTERRALNGAR